VQPLPAVVDWSWLISAFASSSARSSLVLEFWAGPGSGAFRQLAPATERGCEASEAPSQPRLFTLPKLCRPVETGDNFFSSSFTGYHSLDRPWQTVGLILALPRWNHGRASATQKQVPRLPPLTVCRKTISP